MAFLRQWLLGVVSCAFLVSLLDQLTPEGSVRKLARFSGGLVLILCMLRPLGTAEPWELALDLDGFSADRAALEEQYRDMSGQSLATVIAERTGAYIEDKAHALGTEVTAEVTVREEDGAFIPDRAVLFGKENAGSPRSSRRSWGSRRRSRNGGRRDEGCAGGEVARGPEKIPSRRARGAPRHRADAAAGRKMRRPSQQPAVRTPRRSTAARCRRRWRTSCAPSTAWASCG